MSPPKSNPSMPMHPPVDADETRGRPLMLRARLRRAELCEALSELPEDELRARGDLELAILTIDQLLPADADLESPSSATAAAVNRWLEHAKDLAV